VIRIKIIIYRRTHKWKPNRRIDGDDAGR